MSDDPYGEQFSVVQFFDDGTHEYVRRFVSGASAAAAARHYTRSVAAQVGMVRRVIITDGGDCVAWEWKFGEGVTPSDKI